jgi:hypothetical protein
MAHNQFSHNQAPHILTGLATLLSAGLFFAGCAGAAPQPAAEASAAPAAAPEAAPAVSYGEPIATEATVAPAPTAPIVLGYFTNWAHHRKAPCDFKTADVDAKLFSHINYAFALVAADDTKEQYTVIPSSPEDETRLYKEVNELKKDSPDLKTFLSIGGWAFNDKPTEWIFSAMAETPERRGSFIRHTVQYVRKYGFDGIDIDWEFPGDPGRGGKPEDTKNFTALLKEFRAHIEAEAKETGKPELLLTIASPAGPHFRKHMELSRLLGAQDGREHASPRRSREHHQQHRRVQKDGRARQQACPRHGYLRAWLGRSRKRSTR